MILTHLLIATGFFSGSIASVGPTGRATVSITAPLALGIFNSGRNATAASPVIKVRITSSMA